MAFTVYWPHVTINRGFHGGGRPAVIAVTITDVQSGAQEVRRLQRASSLARMTAASAHARRRWWRAHSTRGRRQQRWANSTRGGGNSTKHQTSTTSWCIARVICRSPQWRTTTSRSNTAYLSLFPLYSRLAFELNMLNGLAGSNRNQANPCMSCRYGFIWAGFAG
jgi:hypothetical protein